MTLAEMLSSKQCGNGKKNMEVELTSSSEEWAYLLTGTDLHSLWTSKTVRL